jgi:hypothetical protein
VEQLDGGAAAAGFFYFLLCLEYKQNNMLKAHQISDDFLLNKSLRLKNHNFSAPGSERRRAPSARRGGQHCIHILQKNDKLYTLYKISSFLRVWQVLLSSCACVRAQSAV